MTRAIVENPTVNRIFPWLLPAILAAAVAISFQGARGLYDTSEGRYAECAREMIESGNYVEPSLAYRPHWSKPPLTYWAIAAGIKLLGPNAWGVRAYNAAAFFLTVLAVGWLGKTIWDKEIGLAASLIYASFPFPALGAWAATSDTLLTLCEIFAVLCFAKAEWGRTDASRRWIRAMWVCFGLAWLTKGPVGLLPLAAIGVRQLVCKKPQARLADFFGILLFIATGLTWHIAVCVRHPELLSYFLGQEIVGRVASASVHNHAPYKAITVYLPVLTLGLGAWLFFAVKIVRQRRLFRFGTLQAAWRDNPRAAFLALWFTVPMIIFAASASRLQLYVLPLFPPIALMLALGLRSIGTGRRSVLILSVVSCLLLVAAKGVGSVLPQQNNMEALYKTCVALRPSLQTVVVSVGGTKLFGLQYYMDGQLIRISRTGKEPLSDWKLADFINHAAATQGDRSYLLITQKTRSPFLKRVLRRHGIIFRRFENRAWVFFLAGADMNGAK